MPPPDEELVATESQQAIFSMSTEEASLLQALGRELASTRSWWGAGVEIAERSVISVDHAGLGQYRIIFRDAIGVVRLPRRQIRIVPKIPLTHFLYIASRSDLAPRTAKSQVSVASGAEFVEILARWCLDAAEELLRYGLRKDYQTFFDHLSEVRGRIDAYETMIQVQRGRSIAVCEFEELSDDAPLNRLVRAACERLARLDVLTEQTRSRARRAAYRMDGVGPIIFGDLRTRVDRVSKAYARVLPLALLVLTGCGISSTVGSHVGSAFLVRTPDLVEDGLRALIAEVLPEIEVTKRRLLLGDSGLSVNPDLVFGGNIAVGDTKYRFLKADWDRSDLNQVITFSTAFGCSRCLLLGFRRDAVSPHPRPVPVGAVMATSLAWNASATADPAESARSIGAETRRWLGLGAASA